jgi:hypothetical protein
LGFYLQKYHADVAFIVLAQQGSNVARKVPQDIKLHRHIRFGRPGESQAFVKRDCRRNRLEFDIRAPVFEGDRHHVFDQGTACAAARARGTQLVDHNVFRSTVRRLDMRDRESAGVSVMRRNQDIFRVCESFVGYHAIDRVFCHPDRAAFL